MKRADIDRVVDEHVAINSDTAEVADLLQGLLAAQEALRHHQERPPTLTAIDRAVDEELVFYHATDKPLPIGVGVYSWGSAGHTPYVVDSERPDDMFNARNAHLFMVKDPRCLDQLGQESENQYVYRVTPTKPVTRANYQWLREASAFDRQGLESEARAAARNYWNGVPGQWPCLDEYLTMAFRVEELV